MNISESLRTGFLELWSHKTRSFLSFFAIAIGVAAFLYTFATIAGMQMRMRKAMELAGHGRINVTSGRMRATSKDASRSYRELSVEDAYAIRREFPGLRMVSPRFFTWNTTVYHGPLAEGASLGGVDEEYTKSDWVYKLRGRFITKDDVANASAVAVLVEEADFPPGKKPAWMKYWYGGGGRKDPVQDYFRRTNLLGEKIRVNDAIFTVVGILEKPTWNDDPRWFRMSYYDPDIYIPLTTFPRHFKTSGLTEISIDTGRENNIVDMQRQIENLLTARHGGQNFEARTLMDIAKEQMANQKKWAYTFLTIGIVAILAGGIGIMNVTLATIFSRIKEIGIRRAIGATRSDILLQFIIEAMMLGLVGGILGIGLGIGMIHYLSDPADKNMRFFTWWIPAVSVLIAIFTGFIFSLYPAYKASKLDPVEALRYE